MAFVSVLLCRWHCATFSQKDCVCIPSVYVNEARSPYTQKTLCISYGIYTYCILCGLELAFISTKVKVQWASTYFWSDSHVGKKISPWKSVKPHCFCLKCTTVPENQYKDSHCLSAYIEVLQNIYQIEVFWYCCSVICTVRSPIVALQVETLSVTKRIL
jgi:hypothetical protein